MESNKNKLKITKLREIGFENLKSNLLTPKHYSNDENIMPLDLILANGYLEEFCLGNIIKYASRFKTTQKINDLVKIIDYTLILYGYRLLNKNNI